MKRILVLLLLLALAGGVGVNAQRPVGDTLTVGDGDYLYQPLQLEGSYINTLTPVINIIDPIYFLYNHQLVWSMMPNGQTTWMEFLHTYPELASVNLGRHITGQEFTADEDMMVIGLAVCPTIITDMNQEFSSEFYEWHYEDSLRREEREKVYYVDTTTANRETEYVQLYTFERVGGQPQLKAEGAWRPEYPHRYMLFPRRLSDECLEINDTIYAPLYEAMFDTGIMVRGKQPFVLAGTYNNNGAVWTQTAIDTTFPSPRLCAEHLLTSYSSSRAPSWESDTDCWYSVWCNWTDRWWVKIDSLPFEFQDDYMFHVTVINIFPILDTLFGTPCSMVTGLQTVEIDSLWATLMWSADARQHEWEVRYRMAADTLGSGTVVTVTAPTVTLTGLAPETEYSVTVRGLCDMDNYSPWGDTLLFTTLQDTASTDTATTDTTHAQVIRRLGNLDRLTRIMPNPAHRVVNVMSSYRLESVAMYDLSGRRLLEQPAEGISAVVNISSLPCGTYIMAIRTLQGVATKKLIIE